MPRLVMWGFALALVPLSLAVLWEGVVMIRAALAGQFGVRTAASSMKPKPPEHSLSDRT